MSARIPSAGGNDGSAALDPSYTGAQQPTPEVLRRMGEATARPSEGGNILSAHVEKLTDLACEVDALRVDFKAVPAWHAALTQAVELLHGVGIEADALYGLGLYAHEDGDLTGLTNLSGLEGAA